MQLFIDPLKTVLICSRGVVRFLTFFHFQGKGGGGIATKQPSPILLDVHAFVCVSVFVPPDREFFAYSHKVGRGRAMHAVALELGFLLLFFFGLTRTEDRQNLFAYNDKQGD